MFNWKSWKHQLCIALLLGAVSAPAAYATPILTVVATPAPAVPGSMVDLDVLISGITDLYAYQFTLSFNPVVLQAADVTEGAFLGSGGSTFFDGGSVNNETGAISFVFNSLIGAIPGVSGNGSLAHISFNVLHAGISALDFSDVLFLDSNFADIAVQVNSGPLVAVPEPDAFLLFGMGLAALAVIRRRKSPLIASAG